MKRRNPIPFYPEVCILLQHSGSSRRDCVQFAHVSLLDPSPGIVLSKAEMR